MAGPFFENFLGTALQILSHDITRCDASLQGVEGVIQAHLRAGHEEVFGHDVFGAK